MAYLVNNNILDDHYNEFATGGITGTPNHGVRNLNTVWGVGSGERGWGQGTPLGTVSAGINVGAAAWATLFDRVDAVTNHTGLAGWAYPANPTAGNDIAAIVSLDTAITDAYNDPSAHVANGTDANSSVAASGTWTVVTTHTVRFTGAVQTTFVISLTQAAKYGLMPK